MSKLLTDLISCDHSSLIALRRDHGWSGYGIYCAIISLLERQPDGAFLKDYSLLAFHLSADEETVRSVVEDYSLFSMETVGTATRFYFPALREQAMRKAEISERRAQAASKRWTPSTKPAPKSASYCSKQAASSKMNDAQKATYQPIAESKEDKSVSPGTYNVAEHPEAIAGDRQWMEMVAARRHCSMEILLKLFALFVDNQKVGAGGSYPSVAEAKIHFFNWLAKSYALNRMAALKREEDRQQRIKETARIESQRISYDEYLRRKEAAVKMA